MTKVDIGAQPIIGPMPVMLLTCGDLDHPGATTIAWTGILASEPPVVYASLRPERHSHGIVQEYGTFVLNLIDDATVRTADFCGVKSGHELNKLAFLGKKVVPGPHTGSPMLADSPVNIECRVRLVLSMGSHDCFVADVVAVHAAERLVDAQGGLNLGRAGIVVWANGSYTGLGTSRGTSGHSLSGYDEPR